jgi:hypothetical protein
MSRLRHFLFMVQMGQIMGFGGPMKEESGDVARRL